MAPVGRHRQEQEAKEMDRAVVDRARRYNLEVPPYDFLELIGKGAFGRVFKWSAADLNAKTWNLH